MKPKRIILFQPEIKSIYGKPKEAPLNLAILAAVLEKKGWEIKCFNLETDTEQEFFNSIRKFKPSVIAISATTQMVLAAANIAKKIKQIAPDIPIIIGGYGVTCDPNYVTKLFDIGVIGEGEETIVELCNALTEDKPLKEVKGIAFKKNNNIIINEPRPFIQDLDSFPFPAYYYFDLKKYGKSLPIYSSKGCPYGCIYCSAHKIGGKQFRARSPKNFVDEVEYMVKKYNIKIFNLVDDNFALDKQRAIDICNEIIRRKLNVEWQCSQGIRADRIDKELLSKMKKAGCTLIGIGVETANPEIMKELKRGISLEKIAQAIKDAKELGLVVKTFNLIGSPSETYNDVKKTLEFNKRLGVHIPRFNIIMPYPGTEIYNIIKEQGTFNKNYSPYKLIDVTKSIKPSDIPYETPKFSFKQKYFAYQMAILDNDKEIIKSFLRRHLGIAAYILYPIFLNKAGVNLSRFLYFKLLRGKIEAWD